MTLPADYSTRVYVRDGAGRPVSGAVVQAIWWNAPRPDCPGTTAAGGTATLHLPADVGVSAVLALKPGVGLDYFENYRSWPPGEQLAALPPEIHLCLDGARDVWVQAVDSSGRPLRGVPLTPWTIKKAGKLSNVNCSGTQTTVVHTDAEGFARFAWMPTSLDADAPQFLVRDVAYHCPRTPWFDLAHPDRPLVARLLRNTRVAGRLLFPDGSPAAGTTIRAEGRGQTNFYCRRQTKSGADGSYEFLLFPEQSYLLAVLDDTWAAHSRRGIVVREGQPLTDIDLYLTRGTRIHGRITVGSDHRPAVRQTVTIFEQGGELSDELKSWCFKHEELVRWAETDESGNYGLRVGPGRYRLRGPDPIPGEELTVEAEEEVVRDFHLPYLSRGMFSGEVRRAATDRAVSNAVVRSEIVGRGGHAGFETVTDGAGCFSCQRWRERTIVYARDSEAAEAGCTEVGEQDEAATVRVSPAATARGKVVDRDGSLRSNEHVFCRMEVAMRDGTPIVFQIETRTDIEGCFTIPGLLVGSSCDVTVLQGSNPIATPLRFTVQAAAVLELQSLVLEEGDS